VSGEADQQSPDVAFTRGVTAVDWRRTGALRRVTIAAHGAGEEEPVSRPARLNSAPVSPRSGGSSCCAGSGRNGNNTRSCGWITYSSSNRNSGSVSLYGSVTGIPFGRSAIDNAERDEVRAGRRCRFALDEARSSNGGVRVARLVLS
jgi:hypothetical protein